MPSSWRSLLFLALLPIVLAFCQTTVSCQPETGVGDGGAGAARAPGSPADYKAIEETRALIGRYYAQGNYESAQPLYCRYISLLEKVGAEDAKLALALQNYADLLRKLSLGTDADTAEAKAQRLLMKSQGKTPYALKEFQLGMSLDEFSRMKPPPLPTGGEVKPVCSCDAGQTVEKLSAEDSSCEIVQCGFWRVGSEPNNWLPAPMSVAGIACTPDFRFVMDQGSYHLFEIYMSFFSSNFKQMRDALIKKYGEPSELTEKVRGASGAVYTDNILVWDNAVSKIKLRKMDGTSPDRSSLRYIHRSLYLQYIRRVNELRDQDANKHAGDL